MQNFKILFLIIFISSKFIDDSEGKFRYRITKFTCETSNKTVLNNASCTYRTSKKASSISSFRGTIIRKPVNLLLTQVTKRKNSDGYQTLFDFKEIEICKILNNAKKSPIPFFGIVLEYMRNEAFSEGNIFDGCDIIGEIKFVNLTMAKLSQMDVFPEGDYFLKFHLFDEVDSNILNFTLFSHLSKF